MARKAVDDVATVIEYLPADGSEILYDDWKAAIVKDHPQSMVQATRTAKRMSKVEFVYAVRTDGDNRLTVKRVL